MRNFIAASLCFFLLTAALPAQATAVNRDQANQYFATCISKASKGVKTESMTALCACTSARLMQFMTAEDLETIKSGGTAGQAAQHKMLMDVYAPCTEVVAADMINFECVNNKKLYDLNKGYDIPKLCACSAQKSADWYQGKARGLMTEILQKDPAVTDAAGALITHPQTRNQMLNNLVACSAQPADMKSLNKYVPPAIPVPVFSGPGK